MITFASTVSGRAPVADPNAPAAVPSGYLTDGIRLFFVERVYEGALSTTAVVLEDCRSLDTFVLDLEDLRKLALHSLGFRPTG